MSATILPDLRKRPYRMGDILRAATAVLHARASAILAIAFLVYVPILVALWSIPLDVLLDKQGTAEGLRTYANVARLLEATLGVIATMAIAVVVEGAVTGGTPTAAAALRTAISRWLSAIGTNLLSGLVVGMLLICLVVPGVVYGVYFVFVSQVVALRKLGGTSALEYSKQLVRGCWWRICALALALWVLGWLAHMAPQVPAVFVPDNPLLGVLADGLGIVVTAFFAVAQTVFFLNTEGARQTEPVTT